MKTEVQSLNQKKTKVQTLRYKKPCNVLTVDQKKLKMLTVDYKKPRCIHWTRKIKVRKLGYKKINQNKKVIYFYPN